ncbi:hypothetical protein ACHAXT_012721 [Thalassiosira profunda]
MGKLALPKVGKRRSSASVLSQLPKPQMPSRAKSLQLPKRPSLPLPAPRARSAGATEVHLCLASMQAVAVDSAIGEASTISSVRSDSLTSFMGNLSPPLIEGFGSSLSQSCSLLTSCSELNVALATTTHDEGDASRQSSLAGEQESSRDVGQESREQPSEDAPLAEQAELMRRWLPKRMSSRLSWARPQANEGETAARRQSSLLDGFHAVVEVGHELADDGDTVATAEVVLGTYPFCPADVACHEGFLLDDGSEVLDAGEEEEEAPTKVSKSRSKRPALNRFRSSGAVVEHLNRLYSSKRPGGEGREPSDMEERRESATSQRE